MQNFKITDAVAKKLKDKHGVDCREVEHCFVNRLGRLLEDKRARHKTNPPTLWFLPKTNQGRILNVMYIQNGPTIDLKSAFEPNAERRTPQSSRSTRSTVASLTESMNTERRMAAAKIPNTIEAWEEGLLGRDEQYVAVADASHEAALDEALGLQAISIRLPRQLIEHYKLIAHFHDVGYQPLMRDVLSRFVPNALKEILEAEQEKATLANEKALLPERRKKAA